MTAIYVGRALELEPARQVADQSMAHDAPGAQARDELGRLAAWPIQAAMASASFAIGEAMPLAAVQD